VYADGDNRVYDRSAAYTLDVPGAGTTTINLTDAANTNFGGTFTLAANSSGNYVRFSINGTGFTLTAAPTLPEAGTRRAPINAIQIVPVASPDFTIAAAPGSRTATQGTSTSYTITAGALNGFGGTIALDVTGLPAGTTTAFSPASVNGAGTATLNITTSSSTPVGSSTLTITGTSGSLRHAATVTLVVNAAPDFTIATAPGSQGVTQGSSTSYTVTTSALNGFSGTVALGVTGAPGGTTTTFTPSSVNGSGTATLNITTASTTPPGGSTLTITGTSGGLTRSATVTLVVSAAPDFTIAAAPGSQSVTQGSSTSYTVTTSALNGFSGTVALGVTGAPGGTTTTFTPSSVNGSGTATLNITTASTTPPGGSTLTITGTSGGLTRSATVTLVVNAPSGAGVGAIGIDFAGTSPTPIGAGEIAGVVPQSNWNNAAGTAQSTPQALVDASGAATNAAVTWSSPGGVWMTPITDQPGNPRMMKGYLDTTSASATTVTVTGLPPRAYDVYVYVDGDNKVYDRAAAYTISGAGITTTTINLTDPASTNFGTTFTRADNSTGNYVRFSINAAGFTLDAAPTLPTSGTRRAPVNGIQIVPTSPAGPPPDFTIDVTPGSGSVTQGGPTSYTVTIGALNGFSGNVSLGVTGAPAGATATFNPATIASQGSATLNIATAATTPAGNWTLTIAGTSGSLSHSTTATLVVNAAAVSVGVIGIDFSGSATTTMAPSESAGVVPQTNWNTAAGAARTTPLTLVNESGTLTDATVTWAASGGWMLAIADQPGDARLMKGYLDPTTATVATVTVAGLPSGPYDIYVYVDGDNQSFTRTGAYQISGSGIAPTTVNVTDSAYTDFAGAFTQSAGGSGNYVKFSINGGGFTLTATPLSSTNTKLRAPVNAIQIVPTPPAAVAGHNHRQSAADSPR
jgi:hypothetical protein